MAKRYSLIAVCCGGLEDVAVSDIVDILGRLDESISVSVLPQSDNTQQDSVTVNGKQILKGDGGCGKLLVNTCVRAKEVLQYVRSVHFWFAYLAHGIVPSSNATERDASLSAIKDIISHGNWNNATNTWEAFRSASSDKPPMQDDDRVTTFCGRCVRHGVHPFGSLDVALTIGGEVISKLGWQVALTNMDCEIVALVTNEIVIVGFNVTNSGQPFSKSSFPSEVRPPVPEPKAKMFSLRPSTAYLLLALAKPLPYDIVVDAMSGCGTGLVEACYGHKCVTVGGDVDDNIPVDLVRDAVQSAFSMSNKRSIGELSFWSVNKLPLCNGSADVLFANIPFRKTPKKIAKHLQCRVPRMVEQVARVLRPGSGRAVFLLQTAQQLLSSLDCEYFKPLTTESRGVNIGGYVCIAVVAYRSEKVFVEPKKSSEMWERVSGGRIDGAGASGGVVGGGCASGGRRRQDDNADDGDGEANNSTTTEATITGADTEEQHLKKKNRSA